MPNGERVCVQIDLSIAEQQKVERVYGALYNNNTPRSPQLPGMDPGVNGWEHENHASAFLCEKNCIILTLKPASVYTENKRHLELPTYVPKKGPINVLVTH